MTIVDLRAGQKPTLAMCLHLRPVLECRKCIYYLRFDLPAPKLPALPLPTSRGLMISMLLRLELEQREFLVLTYVVQYVN
jgi:hypothetical protein